MTSQEIRQQFIDFFVQKHGHTFVPSSPVVPPEADDSLLFTNAGMNQFKPYFLGQEKAPWPRVANTQKCIRAGGKHNDLDDVGRSRRHHTFFEMLGNWSFGDYFKRGAIEMAWELLTKVWKLDPARLHVSCYEGSAAIPRDTEAADIWKQVAGVPDDHIHFFGKDNFWEMGDTGPCGPCTEIYYDRRPQEEIAADKKAGRRSPVNGEDPRVMEIWNNVFMQYNRDAAGKLTTLPAQHVDTGMGLERICQVLQGKDDNYATDLWTPLFEAISQISNLKYMGKFPKTNAADPVAEAADAQLRHDIAFRVVADHVRCLTFALTDGAVPSNEGRGYVLRRILRRAVRFGRQQLGLNEPFLHRLVPVIVESMGQMFPELRKNPGRVVELVKDEEASFGRTLDRGIALFAEAENSAVYRFVADKSNPERDAADDFVSAEFKRVNAPKVDHPDGTQFTSLGYVNWGNWNGKSRPLISGSDAFKLHDTYGFPIDLTRIMAEERGITVDIPGYETLMEEAKERARSGGKDGETKIADLAPDAIAQLAKLGVKSTDDQPKYSHAPTQAQIKAIWDGSAFVDSIHAAKDSDRPFAIVLDRTNFYAEMGGQAGDSGTLSAPGMSFIVTSTHAVGGFVLHVGQIKSDAIKVGTHVTATVDPLLRPRTEKNHTTTHLANWALRETLGDDVQQKGSLVDPEKLRFDFSHGKALSDDELAKVETLVNEGIAKKLPVYAEVAPQEKALKIHGLRAVFGEKYPPMVRVVSVGAPVKDLLADPANPKWRQYSVEFCGGTHLADSGQAGSFAITAEESVSKGIRRIVALTGDEAETANRSGKYVDSMIAQGRAADDTKLVVFIETLKLAIARPVPLRAKRRGQAAITEFQTRLKAIEKANKAQPAGKADVGAISSSLLESATPLGESKLIVAVLAGVGSEQALTVVDSLKKKAGSYAVFLAATGDGKLSFVSAVSDDLIAKGLKAGDWLKEAAKAAGGAGGGRPQMAQGSGKDLAKLQDALDVAKEVATRLVK